MTDEIERVLEGLKSRYLIRLREDHRELLACADNLDRLSEFEASVATAKRIAHRLAGVSKVFGFEGVQAAAEMLENVSLPVVRDESVSTTLLLMHLKTLQLEIALILSESLSG